MLFKNKMMFMLTLMILCSVSLLAQGQMQQQPQQQNEAQQLFMEYNQLSQQLQELQKQALSDEKIAKKGDVLDAKITDAMLKNNPEIQQSLNKRDALIAEYQQAQQAGNQEKIQQLSQEFQTVNQTIQTAQQKVMQKSELKTDVEQFQETVMNKMEEINPQVPQLMNRIEEIQSKLAAMQQSGQ